MRKKDRETAGLADNLAILDKCSVIRTALCADGRPYIVPMNFAYELVGKELAIYLHCASEGRKLDMMMQNPFVCFEADCSFKLLASEKACGWSCEYESVIGEGEMEILEDEAGKIKALDALMKKYGFPGQPSYSPKALEAVTALRIRVSSMTGKRKLQSP